LKVFGPELHDLHLYAVRLSQDSFRRKYIKCMYMHGEWGLVSSFWPFNNLKCLQ